MDSNHIVYKEVFNPWFKPLVIFLPLFYKYGIVIFQKEEEIIRTASPPPQEEENQALKENNTPDLYITFGYGMTGPSTSTDLISQTIPLKEIDPSSVVTGTATAKDNLLEFGGWGIRYNFKTKTWAYNAINGPFIEFVHLEGNGTKQTKYRIVSKHVEEVVSILLKKQQN
mmetsp:Transcript_438/g.732  ORF Transcript_438/g.732 Transcript_438/m.732 type:complete len:170 (+) Transcript_438:116-625(+)|eukprot:CAMPEP_0176497236 /NCGR_PEP_ID=MMETSP0200_2-20121128/11612_1 /TAXON_ID=947934 /ORGANISM="Chaetoceros sp., Strain GSL56" /LENGTH=169 /DNA_ID=CAMNT_0017895227 /DNA_START=112 /DNA_END=621 /DNA_ORIENTATION=-